MVILSEIQQFLTHTFGINNIQDCFEIIFFTTIISYFLKWLKNDQQKNLVYPFFLYSFLLIASYHTEMQAISYFLLTYLPVAILIFILVHQDTLQKNFITLNRIKPKEENYHWFDELTRSCLSALNNNKETIFIIEKNNHLKDFIIAPFKFNSEFRKEIFDILVEKHTNSTNSFIWLNQEGKLVAINCKWKVNIANDWINHDTKALQPYKQEAIYMTSKTDALVFKINVTNRTFDIIKSGKIIENITPQQAFSLIERYLQNTNIAPDKPLKWFDVAHHERPNTAHPERGAAKSNGYERQSNSKN